VHTGGRGLAAGTKHGSRPGNWERKPHEQSWPLALLDVAGDEFLGRLARHLGSVAGADAVWICACVERSGSRRLQSVAGWDAGGEAGELYFDPSGTPCQQTLTQGFGEVSGVCDRYPASPMARRGFDGFLGVALAAPASVPHGMIILLTRASHTFLPDSAENVRVFARRTGDELRNRTARVAAEVELGFLKRLLDAIPNPVFFKDAGFRYRECNTAFERMLGRTRNEIIGKTVFDMIPQEYAELNHLADLAALEQGQLVYENGMRFADGSRREVIYNKATLYVADGGGAAGVVGTIQDISAQRQAEREVHRLANFDATTGLPNRNALLSCLASLCESGGATGRWVMTLDIDKFHALHAGFGHDCCNSLLQLLGQRLIAQVAERGLVARIGGDKFGLFRFAPLDETGAGAWAEQVRELMQEPFVLAGQQLHATVCVGLAQAQAGDDAAGLLRCAETALHQAKGLGRGSCQLFVRDLDRSALTRLALEADLRQALGRREFSLVFQPQVDLFSREVVGLEALLRWQHPARGTIPPDQFIPLAEETGLILEIGRWVMEEACVLAHRWQMCGLPPLRVAVNVSSRQLKRAGFCDMISDILRRSGLEANWLELELTESTVMEHTETNIRILDGLKALGVHLAIDDFGTGYSSLAYLQRFPIDKLKIDRTFIADLPSANGDKAIAEAIIALAHGLGLQVVAEGVETAAQAEFLLQRGCNLIQGFYSGRPLTPDGVVALLSRPG